MAVPSGNTEGIFCMKGQVKALIWIELEGCGYIYFRPFCNSNNKSTFAVPKF